MNIKAFNGKWPWVNFTPAEIACKHCGEIWDEIFGYEIPKYFIDSMDKLQALRLKWGKPMILNSAHRCKKHNENVGGSEKSQHLNIAFDVRMHKDEQAEFICTAEKIGFNGIGIYDNFIHLDNRDKKARW